MTTEVKERVVTEFEISDRATAHLGGMQGAFTELGGAINGTISQMFNLRTVVAGVIGGLGIHKVIEIGEAFEATQTQLAGFLQVQKMVPTFNAGLETAATTMGALNRAAAVLSGTTEEYTGVFLQAFSNVRKATGGSIEDVYTFTNKMTAVGKAFKLESSEIGRQLTALLAPGHGMAGMHNVLFQRMLASMQQVKGQANLTAAAFNAMTQKERFDLLSKTVGQFDDMIKATAHSWEAMAGTFKSNTRMMIRVASANVFEGLKSGLGHINEMLVDSNGKLTEFGQGIVNTGTKIGNFFVSGTERAIEALRNLHSVMRSSPVFAEARSLFQSAIGGAGSMFGRAGEAMRERGAAHGGAGIMAASVLGGVKMAGMIPGVGGFLSHIPGLGALMGLGPWASITLPILVSAFQTLVHHTSAVTEVFNGVRRIVGTLTPLFEQFTGILASAGELLGSLAAEILPVMVNVFQDLASAIVWLTSGPLADLGAGLNSMIGVMNSISAEEKAKRDNPNLRQMTVEEQAALQGWGVIKTGFTKAIEDLSYGTITREKIEYTPTEASQMVTKLDDYQVQTDRMMAITTANTAAVKAATAAAAAPPAHRGGGGRAVQDFRYSRFEIQQKFAEGYDPDRIAVAFAKDVGRIGEMRLQSAHEPLYSTH